MRGYHTFYRVINYPPKIAADIDKQVNFKQKILCGANIY